MYTKYVSGIKSGSEFNLLVTGGDEYKSSSGVMIKNDTSIDKGLAITHTSTDDANVDFRSTKDKSFSMRLQSDANPTEFLNLLVLKSDDQKDNTVYGATVGGRVKASQLHTNVADTRLPINSGVYLGHDEQNTGYLKNNRGTGTGGYTFQTHDNTGALVKTHLELTATGDLIMPEYKDTNDTLDTESLAIATFDSFGKLNRSYGQNARFRSIEERLNSVESDSGSTVPNSINEIIRRMNALSIFSTDITELVTGAAVPTAAPTSAPTPLAYPPIAMTANTTVVSGQSYGNGTYIMNDSSNYSDTYKAFDNSQATSWRCASGDYQDGYYVGSATTNVSGIGNLKGEWIQIQLPTSIVLKSYVIDKTLRGWSLVGSSDGITWELLHSVSNEFTIQGTLLTYTVNTSSSYSRYRLIGTNTPFTAYYLLFELKLFGIAAP